MSITADSTIDFIINALNNDITHIGIGTGAAPAAGDILLASEAERKAVTTLIDGNTLIKEGFWDTGEGNGMTYTNAALFGDGASSTIGTGSFRVGGAINVAKDSTQSLTVSIETTVEAVNT
jgi:hypothetical protein